MGVSRNRASSVLIRDEVGRDHFEKLPKLISSNSLGTLQGMSWQYRSLALRGYVYIYIHVHVHVLTLHLILTLIMYAEPFVEALVFLGSQKPSTLGEPRKYIPVQSSLGFAEVTYPESWEDLESRTPIRVPYTTIGSFLGTL